MDKIDAEAVAVDGRLDTLETAVGSGGNVVNASKATNVAGGVAKNIPIQSAANTTTFVAEPSGVGQLLKSTSSPPYAVWAPAVPYKMQSGIIFASDWLGGATTVNFPTAFNVSPIVTLTPISANGNLITSVTLTSAPNASAFAATARTYNGTAFATASPVTHWVAVQYASDSGSS
jgi:hypothetical protein